jgi:polar amino acid transport system substrate-binding protein
MKYGFPSEPSVKFGMADAPDMTRVAATSGKPTAEPATAPALATDAAVTPSAQADAASVVEGRGIFNGTCAHCHGPDAVQSVKKIDLRRLSKKYGDKMGEVFKKTVVSGRPNKGMPAWREVFTDDQFAQILDYLKTVQTDPPPTSLR